MATRIVMNNGESHGEVLDSILEDADTFLVVTAYLSKNGLDRVKPALERILNDNGCVNLIHGFYPHITDTETIKTLTRLVEDFDTMRYGVHMDLSHSLEGSFHPKMFLTHSVDETWRVLIGSSNLTRGGLKSNLEVNCLLTGSTSDSTIERCIQTFDSIQNDPNIREPTLEWVEAYDQYRYLELKARTKFQNETREAYQDLCNIANRSHALSHPFISPEHNEHDAREEMVVKHKLIFVKTKWETVSARGNVYEAARRYWDVDPKIGNQADYVLAIIDGVCKGIFANCRWQRREKRKSEFEGIPLPHASLPDDDKVAESYLEKLAPGYVRKNGWPTRRYSDNW